MRVLFVTDEYPPHIRGGAGVYAYNITTRLAGKVDYEVAVPDKKTEHITTDMEIDGRINVNRVGFIDAPGLRFPSAGYMIGREYGKRATEFDLIHSSSGMGFMLGGRKIETVHHTIRSEKDSVSEHARKSALGTLNSLFYYDVRDRLELKSFKSSKHFIAMSNATKESLVRDYGIDEALITVTHNGVDVERFKPRSRSDARELLGLPADGRMLLFVGRLEERKNIDVLVEAMKELRDYTLIVCGTGSMQSRLESLKSRLNVENVFLMGFVPDDQLPYYYNAADLLVHPADVEGFCLTLVESLASGTPVLAQRKSGMKDILDLCGVREELPAPTPKAIEYAVGNVFSDTGFLECVEGYSRRAREVFSWDKIVENTFNLYRQIINQ
jgi:glycosyltransferase involved in cell wall biosynthesis